MLLQSTKGPGPTIKNSSEDLSAVKQPAVRKRFTKHQICFSRLTPLQQQRREHINQIEYGLTQHPLALYPHLEESVNPEVRICDRRICLYGKLSHIAHIMKSEWIEFCSG